MNILLLGGSGFIGRHIAAAADAAGAREMPPRYRQLARRWELLGYPAFCATVIIYFLMVFKPM